MFSRFIKGVLLSCCGIITVIVVWDNYIWHLNGIKLDLLYLIFSCLSGTIFEELLFRFVLLEYFLKKIGFVSAIIIQSVIFSLAHYALGVGVIALIGYFLGGINYAVAYISNRESNKLLPQSLRLLKNISFPIGLHFGWNFCQSAILGIKMEDWDYGIGLFSIDLIGKDVFTGGTYGYEGGILQIISRVLILTYLVSSLKKTKTQFG